MSKAILKDIESVYERMIDVFLYLKPTEDLNSVVIKDFVGYGTAEHEIFESREELMGMAINQAEQLRDLNVEINRKPVLQRFLSEHISYFIIEEIKLDIKDIGHQIVMRLSTILELINGEWKITHFHGSTPDPNISSKEALPVVGLAKKNRELDK